MINASKRSRQRLLASLFSLVWLSGWAVPSGPSRAASPAGGHDVPEPYVVYVAHEAVYTRCGPDGEYYRTDPLRLGQSLEVYLETDDGWLGVRPPENSFSWVVADDIELAPDEQSGRVVGRQVVAWIGTHLGRARKYRWQVELPAGEEVAIIGKTERQDGETTETWYRIVPPSGEFRWVHRTQIVDSTEALVQMHRNRPASSGQPTPAGRPAGGAPEALTGVSPSDRGNPNSLASIVSGDEAVENAPREDSMAVIRRLDAAPIGSGVAGSASPVPTDTVPNDTAMSNADSVATRGRDAGLVVGDDVRMRDIAAAGSTPTAGPPAAASEADVDSWVTGRRPERSSAMTPAEVATVDYRKGSGGASDHGRGLRPTSPPVLQTLRPTSPAERAAVSRRCATADIDTLQLELSRQLAAGASASLVEPIRQRAEQLVGTLEDRVERGHARLLLERVEQYQRIARRRDGEPAVTDPSASTASRAGVSLPSPTIPGALPSDDEASYDKASDDDGEAKGFLRVGYLVQVYSSRPHAPPYAINDASGRTLAYVSPALGVRLRSHLNQHVGLQGELKFHTGLNTPHIIANQAVPVQR